MKKILFLFLLIVSSQTFAEWKAVSISKDRVFYVDFNNLRESDGYIFFWISKPKEAEKFGRDYYKSFKTYKQADCKLFQVRYIQKPPFIHKNLEKEI